MALILLQINIYDLYYVTKQRPVSLAFKKFWNKNKSADLEVKMFWIKIFEIIIPKKIYKYLIHCDNYQTLKKMPCRVSFLFRQRNGCDYKT